MKRHRFVVVGSADRHRPFTSFHSVDSAVLMCSESRSGLSNVVLDRKCALWWAQVVKGNAIRPVTGRGYFNDAHCQAGITAALLCCVLQW